MGLLIHSPRHPFGSTASADFAAMLSIVEGIPAAETYACEWCGEDDATDHGGAFLCSSCADEVETACSECDGTGQAYGQRDSGYPRWGDCPCCDGSGVEGA